MRQGVAMFGLVVRFDLEEGSAEGFDQLVGETAPLIRSQEPGTLIYACHAVQGEPSTRIFYELYRDREAFEELERQPHVKRFLAEREQYFAGPPRVEWLSFQGGKGVPAAAAAASRS